MPPTTLIVNILESHASGNKGVGAEILKPEAGKALA